MRKLGKYLISAVMIAIVLTGCNNNKINDIKYMDDYIKNYCSYGSKIFLLKKVR